MPKTPKKCNFIKKVLAICVRIDYKGFYPMCPDSSVGRAED